MNRRGEKLGWVLGWTGGFLWIQVLSIVWIVQGHFAHGAAGTLLFGSAIVLIRQCAPWKHPDTRYWKLMAPLYGTMLLAVALCLHWMGGFENGWAGLRYAIYLMPCLTPLLTMSGKTWAGRRPGLN